MKILSCFAILVFALNANAQFQDLEKWIQVQTPRAIQGMVNNISAPGTAPGIVIASPSRQNPDYFYHWVRDAGLTMQVVFNLMVRADNASDRAIFLQMMINYVELVKRLQKLPGETGLGEPKYNVNVTPYTEPWGRPQNDGPAIRALTLTRFALYLIQNGEQEYVLKNLYGTQAGQGVIRKDLEYVLREWRKPNFDLWEEVLGDHFYTRMVQRRSLIEALKLAEVTGDQQAYMSYSTTAAQISTEILKHVNPQTGTIDQHINFQGGHDYKVSNLDTATLLASIHADGPNKFFSPANPHILNTAFVLQSQFARIYDINKATRNLKPAIGRYPEDRYFGGNPWFLTTHAFAEVYYKAAKRMLDIGYISLNYEDLLFFQTIVAPEVAQTLKPIIYSAGSSTFNKIFSALVESADSYLLRSKMHTAQDGSMAEQISRFNGFELSARDLTWSYASFLSAVMAREDLKQRYYQFYQ